MTQPTEFVPSTLQLYRRAVQTLERALLEVQRGWDTLVERINRLLQRVEDELADDSILASLIEWWTDRIASLVDRAQSLLGELDRLVGQLMATMRQAVSGSTGVLALFDVALNWATKVNVPLSELVPDMAGSGGVDHWRGPTKITYEKRVQWQIDAATRAVDQVKATSSWLAQIGEANAAYLTQLAGQAAEVAGALATVMADATATASGALTQLVFTLEEVSETIGTIVTNAIVYAANLGQRLATVLQQVNDLMIEQGDHLGLPGGKWPQPVTR